MKFVQSPEHCRTTVLSHITRVQKSGFLNAQPSSFFGFIGFIVVFLEEHCQIDMNGNTLKNSYIL